MRGTIERCLRSVLPQSRKVGAEVIVVDSSTDGTDELVKNVFPGVRVVHVHERKFPSQAKQLGIDCSQGNVVAIIDSDCTASEDWLETKLRCHAAGQDAVFGRIRCHPACSLVGWAYYFVEFAVFLKHTEATFVTTASECNISYAREVLKTVRYRDIPSYTLDAVFHRDLIAKGYKIYFEPSHIVYHYFDSTVRSFLRHEVQHGFAGSMTDYMSGRRKTILARIAYLLAGPLLPFLKLAVIVRAVMIDGGKELNKFLLALPLTLLGAAAWTFGAWWANISMLVAHRVSLFTNE